MSVRSAVVAPDGCVLARALGGPPSASSSMVWLPSYPADSVAPNPCAPSPPPSAADACSRPGQRRSCALRCSSPARYSCADTLSICSSVSITKLLPEPVVPKKPTCLAPPAWRRRIRCCSCSPHRGPATSRVCARNHGASGAGARVVAHVRQAREPGWHAAHARRAARTAHARVLFAGRVCAPASSACRTPAQAARAAARARWRHSRGWCAREAERWLPAAARTCRPALATGLPVPQAWRRAAAAAPAHAARGGAAAGRRSGERARRRVVPRQVHLRIRLRRTASKRAVSARALGPYLPTRP